MKPAVVSFLGFFLLLISFTLQAQLPYIQSFKNSSATGVVMSGNAKLTAAAGLDSEGDGYLRLTDNLTNQVGYVYAKDAFPSNYGLTISFEFYTYKADANGSNQADGICFFLFDASVNAFRPGGLGGSLGYAQYYNTTPGMAKGYLGIGIDEFGNFSSNSENRSGGTPGKNPCSVVLRGPGNGKTSADYPYITHVQTNVAPYNISFQRFTQRYPDPSSPNYRRLKIVLTPGSSLGTDKGFTVSVSMFRGGATVTEVPLITGFDYPYLSPSKLQYGFTASTGANTDYHEIRNLRIEATVTSSLVAPVAQDDNLAICQGPVALLDVTANDVVNNAGSSFIKGSIDLDPAAPGVQSTLTDAGKGVYTVDQNGIVAFTPINGFIGTSAIQYAVSDTYGTQSQPAGIQVTVSPLLGPSLTVTNPAPVCAPQVVDITSASLRSNTTAGVSYSFFNSLTDANNNTNSMGASATAISTNGNYYIRGDAGVCYAVQPVTVQVSQPPSIAGLAVAPGYLCAPGSLNFTAIDPLVGTGLWSQVSGPASPVILSPIFPLTAINIPQQGIYTFRWTVSNGACASSSKDVVLKVSGSAVAGSNQTLNSSATAATLQASDPAPGTGVWTQIAGPASVIASPSSPQTVVSGLTAGSNYSFRWTTTNGPCVSNAQMSVTVPSTLPVRFLSFTGEKQEDGVWLHWQTATELGNAFFEVEKSTDAVQFAAIAKISGAGTSAVANSYRYLDKREAEGRVVYYRLRQVDGDGKATYSAVVKVALDNSGQGFASVWPNPFRNVLRVSLKAATAGVATLRLYDKAGRLLARQQQPVTGGSNILVLSPAVGLARGVYLLEVENDGRISRQKLIKE